MRILAYRNPFKLDQTSFWGEIKDLPHFCVSQTLVQGIRELYGRDKIPILYTIEDLIKIIFTNWVDNPEKDIKRFISLSNEIEKISDPNTKNSFKFNQREVLEAIKFLIELDIETTKFSDSNGKQANEVFANIYNSIRKQEVWKINRDEIKREGIRQAFFELLEKEEKEKQDQMGGETGKRNKLIFKNEISFLSEVKEELEDKNLDKIVFHGIHQFTPLMLKLFELLNQLNIEPIFLIHYQENSPTIYETWEKVYSWTKCNFELDAEGNHHMIDPSKLGNKILELLELGKTPDTNDFSLCSCYKFDNITSFSDFVARNFIKAKETLRNMNEHFYATENDSANEMLKAQFPDHFGEKPFLSYPIGQFILGLYNLWDQKKGWLKYEEKHIRECLAIDFLGTNEDYNPLETFEKTKIYFSDVSTFSAFEKRIETLLEKLKSIKEDQAETLNDLKIISCFNVSIREVEAFQKTVIKLRAIAKGVFNNQKNGKINYHQHFKRLIEFITSEIDEKAVCEKEMELIEEIKAKLENIHELDLEGTIQDLKEAIHFFLSKKEKEDPAWIVRNFEQIDGGVFLSKKDSNRKYHLAMVSNEKINKKVKDLLPWPLNPSFLEKFRDDSNSLQTILTSKEEYANFLRFSFFYAVFFIDQEISISYIEGSEEEKGTPYFILDMLGIDFEEFEINESPTIKQEMSDFSFREVPKIYFTKPKIVEAQKFDVCSYRYLMDHLIEESQFYQEDYHITRFYKVLLLTRSWERIKKAPTKNRGKIVEEESGFLKPFFPFMRNVKFTDLEREVIRHFEENDQLNDYEYYLELRKNFIVAKIPDENNENIIKGVHKFKYNPFQNSPLIKEYIESEKEESYPEDTRVCEFCKQASVCLYPYQKRTETNFGGG